jgi:hypothetical protein
VSKEVGRLAKVRSATPKPCFKAQRCGGFLALVRQVNGPFGGVGRGPPFECENALPVSQKFKSGAQCRQRRLSMNRFVVGLVALTLLFHSASAAKGDFIYDVEQKGTLTLEFTTADFVVGGTRIDPFSGFQLVPSGFATSGIVDGLSNPKFVPTINYLSFDRSSHFALQLNTAIGGPLPSAPGTYSLTTNSNIILSNQLVGVPDTLVIKPVPEPASLTLFGLGMVCLVGYAWRQRQRSAGVGFPIRQ